MISLILETSARDAASLYRRMIYRRIWRDQFAFWFFTLLYFTTSPSNRKIAVLVAYGQETPYAIVPTFDRTVSYRTNVCDRQLQLYNGTLVLPDALRGLNLTVSITNYVSGIERVFFSLDPTTNKIDETNPGVFALILDELAIRAGFTWRNSFIPLDPFTALNDANQTWTDVLRWATDTFDISMDRWAHTVDRLDIPVSFPVAWYDNSIILGEIVQPVSKTNKEFNLWNFLDPFHGGLWLTLVCTIVATGLVYYVLELWNHNSDEPDLECNPIISIFYAAVTYTGHYELNPQTHPSRLVGFSFTFWTLIVVSSYTANLASFLVSQGGLKFKYGTIDKILQNNAHVCVQKGGAVESFLMKQYPNLILVPKFPDEEMMKSLRYKRNEGGCDVVAHQRYTFQIYRNFRETNPDCGLHSEGRIVEVVPAGLATAVDTGLQHCTSLISHVLDYHLTTMIDDGFLDLMWKSQLDHIATISCGSSLYSTAGAAGSSTTFGEDTTYSLTVKDVGGILILHVMISVVAITIAITQFYIKRRRGYIIGENRTISAAFGITRAKQVFESTRLSLCDLSLRSNQLSLYNKLKKFQRSDGNHTTALPNGADSLNLVGERSGESCPIPSTTPANGSNNDIAGKSTNNVMSEPSSFISQVKSLAEPPSERFHI